MLTTRTDLETAGFTLAAVVVIVWVLVLVAGAANTPTPQPAVYTTPAIRTYDSTLPHGDRPGAWMDQGDGTTCRYVSTGQIMECVPLTHAE